MPDQAGAKGLNYNRSPNISFCFLSKPNISEDLAAQASYHEEVTKRIQNGKKYV